MATWIAARIEHRSHPGEDKATADAVARALAHPCFGALSRISLGVRAREKRHTSKTTESMVEFLLDPTCDDLILDSGRTGDLIASARIPSGRHTRGYDDPQTLISSYVVVPAASPADELVDGLAALASSLKALSGFVAVEPDFDRAHRAAHNKAPRSEDVPDYPALRRRERAGHDWHEKQLETQVSGPEWGVLLGPGHLDRLSLRLNDPFVQIRETGQSRLALLTSDPQDALEPEFDAKLQAARKALAPVLMDLTDVPTD